MRTTATTTTTTTATITTTTDAFNNQSYTKGKMSEDTSNYNKQI
jgi:hypothetical protein